MTMPGELTLAGRGRDLHTALDGTVTVLDTASFDARVDDAGGQIIGAISATTAIDGLDTFVSRSASRGYRRELSRLATEQDLIGQVVYQLLDDLPGATLVSGYSPQLVLHDHGLGPTARAAVDEPVQLMAGVCAGWQQGGVVMTSIVDGMPPPIQVGPAAPSLAAPGDPWAWHESPGPMTPHGMRRLRRIDVIAGTDTDDPLTVDAFFRDSSMTDAGLETIVHEYTLLVTVDRRGSLVLESAATPRALEDVAALAGHL